MNGHHNFRKAYVMEPSHDFSALSSHCEEIVFLTTGYERDFPATCRAIREGLQNFQPEQDVLIPTGRVAAVLFAGYVLGRLQRMIQVGLYANKIYTFEWMNLIPDNGGK